MIVLDVLFFICIVIVYVLIAQAVVFLPFFILGIILSFIEQVFNKKIINIRSITSLEIWFTIFLLIIFLFAYFKYQLWTDNRIYIWSNPILFLLLYLRSVLGVTFTGSNPLLRNLSTMVWLALIPLIVIELIGITNEKLIEIWVIKWGIVLSIGIIILTNIPETRKTPLNLEKFENLENRQEKIAEKINRLFHIVHVIGDMGEAKDLSNLSADLNTRYSKADDLLQQGNFSDAENIIIQSEIDINQIEESLENRIRYSLKEEIKSRLEQHAKSDIQLLRKELETELISTGQIDELDLKIQELVSSVNSLPFKSENISEQLEPFEKIITSISDIKTGLRLRKNVGSQLDKIHEEIDESQLIIDMASNLGLETSDSKLAKKQAFDLLIDFQKKELMSPQELTTLYKDLQKNLTKFRESIAILKANIDRNWICHETASSQLTACVSRYCRTDKSTIGVLVLKKEGSLQTININIDGTLIEFETDRNIILSTQSDSDYVISSFNFVGKRAGLGSVRLRSNEVKELQNIMFSIRIIPTVVELARNSFLFGASFGAIVLLLFWYLGYAPKDYSSLAVAIGTALSLILFVLSYISISKYK